MLFQVNVLNICPVQVNGQTVDDITSVTNKYNVSGNAPVMSGKVGPLRVEQLVVVELEELSEAVCVRAAARARAPHQHVRQRRAPRGARAGPRGSRRAPRPRRGPRPAALRRDQVVRGPRVRAVVQLVDGHVDARATWDRLSTNIVLSINHFI